MTSNLKLIFGHDANNVYGAVNTSTGSVVALTSANTNTAGADFLFTKHDTQTATGVIWPDTEDAIPHSFYDSSADPDRVKGVFYNAYVASAGHVQQANLSATHYYYTSICPKGWGMMDYLRFAQLVTTYGFSSENYGSIDANASIMNEPVSLTWSGYYNWNYGTWNSRNTSHDMWTNRYQSNGNVTRIYFRNDGADGTMAGYISGGKPWHGRPVRCVAL